MKKPDQKGEAMMYISVEQYVSSLDEIGGKCIQVSCEQELLPDNEIGKTAYDQWVFFEQNGLVRLGSKKLSEGFFSGEDFFFTNWTTHSSFLNP